VVRVILRGGTFDCNCRLRTLHAGRSRPTAAGARPDGHPPLASSAHASVAARKHGRMAGLGPIEAIVVLMFENRAFDDRVDESRGGSWSSSTSRAFRDLFPSAGHPDALHVG